MTVKDRSREEQGEIDELAQKDADLRSCLCDGESLQLFYYCLDTLIEDRLRWFGRQESSSKVMMTPEPISKLSSAINLSDVILAHIDKEQELSEETTSVHSVVN